MWRKFILLIAFSAWATAHSLYAQRYANAFLRTGVGAAEAALGGAVTARDNGVFSAYWNPAALPYVTEPSAGLMHAALFRNAAQSDYAVYVRPGDEQSTFAAALLRLGVDRIMNTTRLLDSAGRPDYNRITYFSAADYALMLSYGRKGVKGNWDAGMTVKLLYRHIGDFARAYGFGFDAGIRFRHHDWTFAALLRDAASTFSFWTFNDEKLEEIRQALPGANTEKPARIEFTFPQLQTGIARKFSLGQEYGLLAEVDLKADFFERPALVHASFLSLSPSLGLEGDYKQKVFLRLGVREVYRTTFFGEKIWKFNPSAGTGIRMKYWQVDYAFTGMAEKGFFSHVFSLSLDFRLFKKGG
ncbi:MAG: hypothetical protein GXO27_01325 [Chlorobi bacterium]|nr:hypothetical protein [Chlorobiota bacterium]